MLGNQSMGKEEAIVMSLYRKILIISWTEQVRNEEIGKYTVIKRVLILRTRK